MTARRLRFETLPWWPLHLRLQQAAAYVGVSPETFLIEVKDGRWPQPVSRGRGGVVTWSRVAIDRASEALTPQEQTFDDRPKLDLGEKFRAAFAKPRPKTGDSQAQ